MAGLGTWAVTPTGLEDLLRFRNHAGFFRDELQRVPRENRGVVVQMIYAFTQVQKARGGSRAMALGKYSSSVQESKYRIVNKRCAGDVCASAHHTIE
jgi:hypothetical protein